MLKHSLRLLCAFVAGQLAQVVFVTAGQHMSTRPILWAVAAGLILTVAIFAGMGLAHLETTEEQHQKRGRRE